MRGPVPDGYDERMGAITLALNVQLRPNYRHVGNIPRSADPELHGWLCRWHKNKLLHLMVVMCLSLNTPDIWPMLKFSQSKTTDILVVDCPIKIFLVLLSSQIEYSLHVQEPMDTVLDGKSSIVVDIGSCHHTELVRVLQILVIWQVDKPFGIVDFFGRVKTHVRTGCFSQVVMLKDLWVGLD